MAHISVLGLGIIGSAWAKNLIADGHQVKCWNRTAKTFPCFVPSLEEAVKNSEVVFIVVSDPMAVESVLNQIHLEPQSLVIQSSTISAHWTKQFGHQVERAGAFFLEAPFTGSKLAAEQRKSVFYLGGDPAIAQRARPILERLSSFIYHIGPLGSASTLKLAMNLNIGGVAQSLCESLTLCRAAGIPDDVYFNALSQNASRSGISYLKEPKLRARDYAPQFSLKHLHKDLRLALETASELSLCLPQTEGLKKSYDQGMEAGWGEDDFIGLVRQFDPKR